ncbi:P-loop containing nucleoside triphosphate hydrolases superfamily protein [Actinidia rufa]|uniref:P-loop containing nucleoside triphosphate hydrolases superfamily protein n=1 Tax=Actinidia rufa TaxID=165716 RepID=A0A7J0GFX7_9ERIC|nr:P-loop containing nucleoside triphosphate hydrolases superfamily protein [Actinidia rufa]
MIVSSWGIKKDILHLCENRKVLFDNKTKDPAKKAGQLQQLLSLVNMVISQNGGKPFTNELFTELKTEGVNSLEGYSKRELSELKEQMHRSYEEQLKRITEMIESKLSATTDRLQQQLAEEQAARRRVEENAQAAQMKSNDEIRNLREHLGRTRRETEELRSRTGKGRTCAIM